MKNIYSPNSPYIDEEKFVQLFSTNRELAFKEIYVLFFPPLFRHACKILKDEDLAVDTVQEVFIILWTRSANWEIEKSISAFLFHCLRNKILDLIRHEKVKSTHLESLILYFNNPKNHTDYLVRENQMVQLIENEISRLPKKMRYIFELSRKKHLTYKEIAIKANVTEGTVRKQVYYALKILRSKLSSCILFKILPF